ncbi:alpha/beta hydrolase [Flavobacterium sp. NRK F7]|uniref:alpha/beta hydrolase n=1 Tax=Flavobacterium sp. NRK F7 TaxID=2954930 RepID=UPI002091A9D2|nr:alpha/beta hydrolase [Flavobacterium sp. NRK F7]MCO6163897.1 alpha/beta hydrolase [Flavobacterium sp. NRK F7]
MSKIPVYFMPGLAASSIIFENIKLPEDAFEMHFLEWFVPKPKESLEAYALRMTKEIKHKEPVLIGVSFGGILVQEMSKHIETRKTIIISSVKTNKEMPSRMKIAKKTLAYKLIPTSLLSNVELLVKYAFGDNIIASRLKLYEKYLSVRDKKYLDWAIENVILWSRDKADEKVIHIHGDSDSVFPIQNIKNAIIVKGGTHIMIINKYKWLNENLPKIINPIEKT